jgi:hypothetical protein
MNHVNSQRQPDNRQLDYRTQFKKGLRDCQNLLPF